MPASVVFLVIASALAHATWNAILKRCKDPEHAVIGMMVVAGASSLAVALVLRVPMPSRTSSAFCLLSGLLEAGYFITLARALARAPLGTVYTVVRGGALVIVWPISIAFLGEQVTLTRGAGTLLVVLGLASTNATARSPQVEVDRMGVPHVDRSGLAIAAFCALFVGGYHLAYKMALSNGGRPEAIVSISLCTASLLNVLTQSHQRRGLALAAARAQPIRVTIGGLLGSFGFLVFLSAMKTTGAGLILTLRNTSILFAQVMAFGLGERPQRLGIVGAILVTAGAVLLAL